MTLTNLITEIDLNNNQLAELFEVTRQTVTNWKNINLTEDRIEFIRKKIEDYKNGKVYVTDAKKPSYLRKLSYSRYEATKCKSGYKYHTASFRSFKP
jgi:predicted DNA-binding protein YlxM (UPF0122 family)